MATSKTKVFFDNLGRPTSVTPGADYRILEERAARKAAELVPMPGPGALTTTTARIRLLTGLQDLVIDWATPVSGGPEALLAPATTGRITITPVATGRWALKLSSPVLCGPRRDQIRVRWQAWAYVPGFPSASGKIWVTDSSTKFCRLHDLGAAQVPIRQSAVADPDVRGQAQAGAALLAQEVAAFRAGRAIWELLDRASRRALRAG